MIYYGLGILSLIITLGASIYLKYNYKKYSKQEISNKKTGIDVARKILDSNGLEDIYIVESRGQLTDHYDPNQKVIRLSSDVFNGTSISSVAVAAHETGHAIQDKEGYFLIKFRKFLVPFVNFASKIGYVVIVLGLIFKALDFIYVGIVLLVVILFFQLITLPVEFDASNKAKKELLKYKLISLKEEKRISKVLTSAALTYVAGLLTTILEILRLLLIAGNRRN